MERQSSLRDQASSPVASIDFTLGLDRDKRSPRGSECSAVDKKRPPRPGVALFASQESFGATVFRPHFRPLWRSQRVRSSFHFFYPPVVPAVWPSSAEGVVNRPAGLRTVCAAGP